MTDLNNFKALVASANAELTDPARNQDIRSSEGESPRFELYHAGMSLCSQAVRAVLAEAGYSETEIETLIASGAALDTPQKR